MQHLLHATTTKFCMCVCCSRNVEKSMCQLYMKADYDFSNVGVSECLPYVRDCEDEQKYICLSCHKRLTETNNDNIVLPYHGRYPHVKADTVCSRFTLT